MSTQENSVYRFMSIYEFYDLYKLNKLKLTRLSLQEDQNDSFGRLLTEIISHKSIKYNIPKQANEWFNRFKKHNYISCWTQDYDSIAMWSLYSQKHDAIRVKANVLKLEETLHNYWKEYNSYQQWDDRCLKHDIFLSNYGTQEAYYVSLKKDIFDKINQLCCMFSEEYDRKIKHKAGDNYSSSWKAAFESLWMDIESVIPDVKKNQFLKDVSFEHEKEFRLFVDAGFRTQYSKDEWHKIAGKDFFRTPLNYETDKPMPSVLYIENIQNLIEEINRLKKEKNAVIMAHYYQTGDIQDIADIVGDSLALAQWAAKTDADIIVL